MEDFNIKYSSTQEKEKLLINKVLIDNAAYRKAFIEIELIFKELEQSLNGFGELNGKD